MKEHVTVATYMDALTSSDPSQREILVGIGNRYVVFGPEGGRPRPSHFDPERDCAVLPRIADEVETMESRIVDSLRVAGMKRAVTAENAEPSADLALSDEDGHRILIDIKVREHDPRTRDVESALRELDGAAKARDTLEVWFFNIDRLGLKIFRYDHGRLRIDDLAPLNVWERTEDGVFDRAQVVAEVEEWVHRIDLLYTDIESWLKEIPGLRCERTRTVTMSEEPMRQFAVTDRDLPLLDVLEGDEVIISVVPRGLWLVGSWGRLDIITRVRTHTLLAVGGREKLSWQLVFREDQTRMSPFNKKVFLALVKEQ